MTEVENIASYLRRHNLILATAESCTAGLIASKLAEVPGAGGLLECAFVVYSPEAKQRCLGVPQETLRRYNLTSVEVAQAMVLGAAQRCNASLLISNTGVADAAGDGVPAGTQCYAWMLRAPGRTDTVYTEKQQFSGDRNAVREAAAEYALLRVRLYHAQWMQKGMDD